MATKADFTQDEWDLVKRSLTAVSGLVATASPSGLIGLTQEMVAAARTIAESKATPSGNPLVDALAAELAAKPSDADKEHAKAAAQQQLEQLQGKQPEAIKSLLLADLTSLSTLLASKTSTDEAAGFKSWLVTLAKNVAGAAKEGGFLGFGGTAVSTEEQAAIAMITGALGVSA